MGKTLKLITFYLPTVLTIRGNSDIFGILNAKTILIHT